MDCGGSLNAVSASPDQRNIVVGGRDILKTYRLTDDGEVKETKNLRFGRKKGLDLATTDVKWHPVHSHLVASGSTNGTVLTWDVTRPKNVNAQEQQFRHTRTVNRVTWHNTQDSWLLTGSQDGTVRLWDAKCAPGGGGASGLHFCYNYGSEAQLQLTSFLIPEGGGVYHPGADAVRDVQFNPYRPWEFVAALEDGGVQLWDVRSPGSPFARFTAHAGLVMCAQWHPTQPDVLATGGRDRLVRVWQMGPAAAAYASRLALSNDSEEEGSSSSGSGKEAASGDAPVQIAAIQTIASVSQLSWRASLRPGQVLTADVVVAHALAQARATHASGSGTHRQSCHSSGGGGERTASVFLGRATRPPVPSPVPSPVDAVEYQLATCAALLDNNCYVWDIRHTYLPVAVFSGHKDVATGITWIHTGTTQARSDADAATSAGAGQVIKALHPTTISSDSRPMLVSGGKDGKVVLHPPASAHRPHMHLRTTTLALSTTDVAWSHQSIQRTSFWDNPCESKESVRNECHHNSTAPGPGPSKADPFWVLSSDPRCAPTSRTTSTHELIQRKARAISSKVVGHSLEDAHDAFDPPAHVFALLALSYATEGAAVEVLCEHNANIAQSFGLKKIAYVWKTLGALFGFVPTVQVVEGPPTSVRHRFARFLAPAPTPEPEIAAASVPLEAAPTRDSLEEERAPTIGGASGSGDEMGSHIVPAAAAAEGTVAVVDGELHSAVVPPHGEVHTEVLPMKQPAPTLSQRFVPIPAPDAFEYAIPGFLSGLLVCLAAVNPDAADLVTFDSDSESTVSLESEALAASGGGGGSSSPVVRGVGDSTALRPLPPSRLSGVTSGDKRVGTGIGGAEGVSRPAMELGAPLPSGGEGKSEQPPPAAELLNLDDFAANSWKQFRTEVALDILNCYADAGDVQTCVTVSRVLGSEVESQIGKKRLQRWLVSYIDLLHRLQLWAPASTVMARASDEGIRRLNQLHTNLLSGCAHCDRDATSMPPPVVMPGVTDSQFDEAPSVVFAVDGGKTLAVVNVEAILREGLSAGSLSQCDDAIDALEVGPIQSVGPVGCQDCHSALSTCAVCLQPVRGVYAWCQGCGHGGHLEHMLEWFSQHSSLCPTGCMHVCNLQTSMAAST